MNDNDKMTRRQVVAGLGTTVAALAVSPVLANTNMKNPIADGPAKISDPTKLYIPNHLLKASRNPGPASKAKWTRFPIAGKPAIKAPAG
jgi:hypothetical protein